MSEKVESFAEILKEAQTIDEIVRSKVPKGQKGYDALQNEKWVSVDVLKQWQQGAIKRIHESPFIRRDDEIEVLAILGLSEKKEAIKK